MQLAKGNENVNWWKSHRFDPAVRELADRHYNRQKPGTPQFVPPATCLVLRTWDADAFWVTTWPEYAQHAWLGAWVNTAFRNESSVLSSLLIREAAAATRWRWPDVPPLGLVTFVDPTKVRHKRDPGRCYLKAGFHYAGWTRGGLRVLQLDAADFPETTAPLGTTRSLFEEVA